MSKRVIVGLLAVVVMGLVAGCSLVDLVGGSSRDAYSANGQYLRVTEENGDGWVEVALSGGGVIHWGDSFEDGSYTTTPTSGTFGHYYNRPGVYAIRLMSHDDVLDTAVAAVPHVGGHLELVRIDGSTVGVEWYGPQPDKGSDEYQWIVWGDTSMTTVAHNEDWTWGLTRSHTYAAPGTYEVGIRGEIERGDPYRRSFEVTVGQ